MAAPAMPTAASVAHPAARTVVRAFMIPSRVVEAETLEIPRARSSTMVKWMTTLTRSKSLREVKSAMGTMSRFRIHDEESAPEASQPILKGATRSGGQLPNFLGVLAGAPAGLRAYVRFRTELRRGVLPTGTAERIGLAVAVLHASAPDLSRHLRAARDAGIGIDEVRRAQRWDSADARQAALLRWLKPLAEHAGSVPVHLH